MGNLHKESYTLAASLREGLELFALRVLLELDLIFRVLTILKLGTGVKP